MEAIQMRTRLTGFISAGLLLAGGVAAQQGKQAEIDLQAAIRTETVKGDLKGAIEQYKKIAQSGNRALAAQALVHMADCYQKLGDSESRKIYERIVREFGDQPSAVATAKARLGGDGVAKAEPANRRLWTLPEGGDIFGPVSRDGRFVPYTHWKQFGNLYIHDLITGADRALTDTASDGKPGAEVEEYAEETAFSRDGTKLAYSWFRSDRDRYELRVVDLTSAGIPQFKRVFDSEDVDWLSPDDWSPDGKTIVVQLHRKDRTGQIGLIDAANGTLRILKSIDWRGATRLLFSPDGKYVAFDLPANDSTENRDIFALAVDGSREIPLVTHPSHDALLGWSLDGKRLVFASDRGGSMSVWAQPIVDGRAQGTPELLKREIGSAWSSMGLSDSGSLFMQTGDFDTLFDIQTASIDLNAMKLTSAPVQAVSTFVGANRDPVWAPDGRSLAYVSRRTGVGIRHFVIGIRSMETGAIREIFPSPNFELFNGLQWAPDGRSFLVTGRSAKGSILGVFEVDAQTGRSQLLVEGPISSAIAANPQTLFFTRRQGRGLKVESALIERDLASGEEHELIRQPRLTDIRLSPDAKFIIIGLIPSSGGANRVSEILALPTSGGEPRVLSRADGAQGIAAIAWAPDSHSVYVAKVFDPQRLERWLVPLDGSEPTKLEWVAPPIPGLIRMHPDGKQAAFVVQSPRKSEEVWVLENFLPKGGN
jgi:Tol biopolymer transport system component